MRVSMAQMQQDLAAKQQPALPDVPKSSLSIRTPAGKRALTVSIDSLSAVGGLINPGDYVDIMGHLTIPAPPGSNQPAQKVTAILFQNMQVLAVGTNIQTASDYASQQQASALNITFAVDPEEAGLMTFAKQYGRLQLVLRSPSETETQILQPASWEALGEYVLDRHGMELATPQSRAMIQPVGDKGTAAQPSEVEPYIQIWRGGQQL